MRSFRAAFVGLLSFTGSLFAGPVLYTVTPIVAPAGDTLVTADSVNSHGQVAGVAMDGSGNLFPYVMTGGSSVAVSFPSGLSPQQVFINDSGQLAGGTSTGAGAFFGTAAGVSLVPSSAGIIVAGLNNSGTFVGSITPNSTAVTGTSAGITQLPSPFFDGLAINNLGQLLVEELQGPQAVLVILTGANAVPIFGGGLFLGPEASGAFNNNGQVAGVADGGPSGFGPAAVATTTSLTYIPIPTGDVASARQINDLGEVVGRFGPSVFSHPVFVWDPINGIQTLSSLVPAGWTFVAPEGINDAGQILVFGTFMGGPTEAVLLTPIATPEPSTVSMMLATIALFATIRFARRQRSE